MDRSNRKTRAYARNSPVPDNSADATQGTKVGASPAWLENTQTKNARPPQSARRRVQQEVSRSNPPHIKARVALPTINCEIACSTGLISGQPSTAPCNDGQGGFAPTCRRAISVSAPAIADPNPQPK